MSAVVRVSTSSQMTFLASAGRVSRRTFGSSSLKPTVVHALHEGHGGKMVDFAGYSLPVQYAGKSKHALSILDSCLWTRSHASLFDVSHMCSIKWTGADACRFLERISVADLETMDMMTGGLSLMLNEKGGIIDDTLITKAQDAGGNAEYFYQVVNAGCAEKDLRHLSDQMKAFGGDVQMEINWDDRGLFALQGPKAAPVLEKLVGEELGAVGFGTSFWATLCDAECFISRAGYTGEDGFELFVPGKAAAAVFERLLEDEDVRLAGLGVRDAVRLEAGLCLYGHDIDETITPVEASLAWTIAKARRTDRLDWIGAGPVLEQLHKKTDKKRRIGLVVDGPVPAREGMELVDPSTGNRIGVVTSGRESPMTKQKIAMGYLDKPFNKLGTDVHVRIRSKVAPAKVVKMPFVPTKYYKP